MVPNNNLKVYIRVLNSIDVDPAVKQQIIQNCARRSTLHKIKSSKFKITAVKKDKAAVKFNF